MAAPRIDLSAATIYTKLIYYGPSITYGGCCGHIPSGDILFEMPLSEAAHHCFDCIIFQDDDQYFSDHVTFFYSGVTCVAGTRP